MVMTSYTNAMSKAKQLWLFVSLLLFVSYAGASEVIVVGHSDSHISQLTRSQVRQIFMGGTLSRKYHPVILSTDNEVRKVFNTQVIGLTEHRVKAYWSQLQFTGRAVPPVELEQVDEVVEYLLSEPNVVAYLPADTKLPKGLVVLYEK